MIAVLDALLLSPWIYLVIFVVSFCDGLFPFLPSDTALLAVSVAAVSGGPSLVLVAVVGAVGMALGDEFGYELGRRFGDRNGYLRGRTLRLYRWTSKVLLQRGVLLISAGRYIPFGRVTTILAAGAIGYPKVRFSVISITSSVVWACSLVTIGYFSASAFPHNPLPGLLIAVAGLLALSWLIRRIYRRFNGSDQHSQSAADSPEEAH